MRDSILKFALRIIGFFALLAIPCALMPYGWMNTVHQDLGLGQLPSEPIVGYLARSTSAFYAMIGGLLWVISYDLQRHMLVVRYLGAAIIVLGVFLLWVDLHEGLPSWWSFWEGPFNVVFGAALLVLSTRRD